MPSELTVSSTGGANGLRAPVTGLPICRSMRRSLDGTNGGASRRTAASRAVSASISAATAAASAVPAAVSTVASASSRTRAARPLKAAASSSPSTDRSIGIRSSSLLAGSVPRSTAHDRTKF